MRIFLTLAVLATLTGCGSTGGVRLDDASVAELQPGIATYADVVKRFGPPTSDLQAGNGDRAASYGYVTTRVRPETMIPVVGMFVGGADSETQTVTFHFHADGILVNVSKIAGRGSYSRLPFAKTP